MGLDDDTEKINDGYERSHTPKPVRPHNNYLRNVAITTLVSMAAAGTFLINYYSSKNHDENVYKKDTPADVYDTSDQVIINIGGGSLPEAFHIITKNGKPYDTLFIEKDGKLVNPPFKNKY